MKKVLFLILLSLLLYTRLVGLNWGLPYPMHPDERNMAAAIQGLNCRVQSSKFKVQSCLNPHFFAYGQFPLYVGYLIIQIYHFIVNKVGLPIDSEEAVMSLRVISALASVINVIIVINIIKTIKKLEKTDCFLFLPIVIFSPYFIQFSHFGTTEALLMLFYSLIIYYSLKILTMKQLSNLTIFLLSLYSGLAIATKVSAAVFLGLPVIVILSSNPKLKIKSAKLQLKKKKLKPIFFLRYMLCITYYILLFLFLTTIFAIFFSPHNLISFKEFLGSMSYESAVALGDAKVFYTRQFEQTVPLLFEAIKIFPYTLGWPQYLLAILGFFLLSWKKKEINLLRLAFVYYFVLNAFLYAKWTRFMTPILPIMSIFTILILFNFREKIFSTPWRISNIKYQISKIHIKNQKFYILICHFAFYILIFTLIIPGIAYLSIYQNPDVRFIASEWIYRNIPVDSYILFETANVVDVPIPPPNYKLPITNYRSISFNFYDLDENLLLQNELKRHLEQADYIFVPSRRIFMNHYCNSNFQFSIFNFEFLNIDNQKCQYLKKKYPLLNDYYEKLFSGKLGFKKVKEFSSYPKLSLLGKTIIEFPDEDAEETWTVFDHPVIRIYAKQHKT